MSVFIGARKNRSDYIALFVAKEMPTVTLLTEYNTSHNNLKQLSQGYSPPTPRLSEKN